MSDLALAWDAAAFSADLMLADGALATDDGLKTAVLISLFSDARASADDALPQPGADRRGWWGDTLSDAGDEIGSKLWLLSREKTLSSTLERARTAARDALEWLIEDGIASAVEVVAERVLRNGRDTGTLALGVTISRPTGPARQRFDFVWEATA